VPSYVAASRGQFFVLGYNRQFALEKDTWLHLLDQKKQRQSLARFAGHENDSRADAAKKGIGDSSKTRLRRHGPLFTVTDY
jgi:hypothetical protein